MARTPLHFEEVQLSFGENRDNCTTCEESGDEESEKSGDKGDEEGAAD